MNRSRGDIQSRGGCLTINNPVQDNFDYFEFLSAKDTVMYLSAQLEIGKQGTKHIQAYIEGRNPLRFSSVKNMFPTAHIEKRRGTCFEAFEYCLKPQIYSNGNGSVQSKCVPKRSYSVKKTWYELCQRYKTLYDFKVNDEYIYLKNFSLVNAYYLNSSRVPKLRNLEVIYLFGATGIGKTSYVYDCEDDVYIKDCTQGGDGYVGQQVVLIDEYSGQGPIEYLLKVLQGRPMNLQIKGSYVPALYTKVYIVSNFNFKDGYPNLPFEQFQALRRRFSKSLTRSKFTDVWVEFDFF